ncbi:MAG TPA: glycosyl hydrolase family 17 protein [Methanoregulaceae archaeon]|nr:glycosyl hydrolase family 17 protein [Methanoregulaceae archaeon]
MTDRARPICVLVLAIALALAMLASACVTKTDLVTVEPTGGVDLHLPGLCFGPYLPNQSPDWTGPLPPDQVWSRLAIVAPSTDWIRSYGNDNGLDVIGRFSHELGKRAAVGAWLSRNKTANEQQITNLIAIGRAGEADVMIVGSETLLRDDLTESELLGYIERVRQAVPGIPITTAENYRMYLHHPALFDAVDEVYVHIYPFWDGVGIDAALFEVDDAYSEIRQRAGPRPVVVAETGWPSAGEPNGAAVPSMENAERYLRGFTAWAAGNHVRYFYFEAFDEAWKAQYEGEVGAHWGLWDQNGRPKFEGLVGRRAGEAGVEVASGHFPERPGDEPSP